MIYLNAFIFCGIVCLIGQIILDNTKLTPGHITSIFVVLGSILSFLGIYPKFIDYAGVAATIPITSFGNALYQACFSGFYKNGILGMFQNLLSTTSAGITSAVIFASIMTIFFSPKD